MNRCLLLGCLLLALTGCLGTPALRVPADFVFAPVPVADYTLASWQKRPGPAAEAGAGPVRIYVEGDGHAYAWNAPSADPTPRGTFLREIAFADPHPEVVYLARPCQFIHGPQCTPDLWTSGRFSARAADALAEAVRALARGREVVLIGYSGGALLSGLAIVRAPDLRIRKWITIAGLLNHGAWTAHFGDAPLTGSLDLPVLPAVPQTHYMGERDRVVPADVMRPFAPAGTLVLVPGATHSAGFARVLPAIWQTD